MSTGAVVLPASSTKLGLTERSPIRITIQYSKRNEAPDLISLDDDATLFNENFLYLFYGFMAPLRAVNLDVPGMRPVPG